MPLNAGLWGLLGRRTGMSRRSEDTADVTVGLSAIVYESFGYGLSLVDL